MNVKLLDKTLKDFKIKGKDAAKILSILAEGGDLPSKIKRIEALSVKKKDKIICALATVLFDGAINANYRDIGEGNNEAMKQWENKTPSELRHGVMALSAALHSSTSSAPPQGKLNAFMLLIPIFMSTGIVSPRLMIKLLLELAAENNITAEDILTSSHVTCSYYLNDCIKDVKASLLQ